MKNNKVTAEEQDIDKHCSERKACRRKWLATLCLSSSRHKCPLRGNPSCIVLMDGIEINDFVTTTQVQVTIS